ncbi:MAG: aminotransferase class I/II-fold pyridoxal phosphate-dependent enzyme [Firmicutes bacterium]|nr:aminotransferase class I/II-fold pyridoxal phosphate-dependent enzyme [Bacillota bacterium]
MKTKTLSIHGLHNKKYSGNKELTPPINQTATFYFDSINDAEQTFDCKNDQYVYSRGRNPNLEELEDKITLLEEGAFAVSFSSGMGAITTLLMSLLKSGDSLISHNVIYGSSHNLIENILPKYGITTKMIDLRLIDNELIGDVKVIYLETPANPTLDIIDILELRKKVGEEVIIIVDNTFATPILQQPLLKGADFVVHSATKYIGGHGDAIGGLVVGKNKEFEPTLRFGYMCEFGTAMAPFNAWLFNRGLKTLEYRMKGHCKNAMEIATYLEGHNKVQKVYYPGLPTFEGYETAKKQMKDFGGMISFEIKGAELDAVNLVNNLKLFKIAVSLGDTESLVEIPAKMTHRGLNINPSLIRLAVGLEDLEDLLEDLKQGLEII